MSKAKEIIDKIKPYSYSKYKDVSSNEKLGAYTACFLEEKGVAITFNYLCIAMFKFFPDKFCCDEEFKEYPSVDRLNRTLMHMSISKNSPLLNGSAKNGYRLTDYGRYIGKETNSLIQGTVDDKSIMIPKVDSYKSSPLEDYRKIASSEGYKKYQETGETSMDYIWSLYRVIPYTQQASIKKKLITIRNKAKEEQDNMCYEYLNKIITQL